MADTEPFGPAEFRRVLGSFPTGVCVISGKSGDRPIGITVGSFSSISLDPPLVGFFIDRSSSRWPQIAQTGRFCVNILAAHQSDACNYFARQQEGEFAGFVPRDGGNQLPIIQNAVGWIACEIAGTLPIGDHDLIVGKVIALEKNDEILPLVFCQGSLGEVLFKDRALT